MKYPILVFNSEKNETTNFLNLLKLVSAQGASLF